MTREKLIAELRDRMVTQIAMQHHFEGLRKLYDAALMCQNQTLSERYRQEMHDLLDQQLDSTAEIMSMTRQVTNMP